MKYKILLIIIFLGLILRIINITEDSLPLYGDELTIAYDAYSLLKTGSDQQGNFLPLTFEMGAGRPGGYVYFTVPFVALFGPSALGVRLPSVVCGLGIIMLLYLLGRRLFSEKVGLAAAFLASVTPWTIQLSRVGFEANLALFLVVFATYLFIQANKKPFFYLFAAILFGLTLHTYPTYKVSLIFFLPLLFWYTYKKEYFKKYKIYNFLSIGVFLFLVIFSILQTFTGGSEARFANINVFSQEDLKSAIEQKINLERNITILPDQISKYMHNKPVEYTKVIIENYLQNFSLDFLVIHGDRNPRHNMTTMGEMLLVELILILVGLVAFWQKEKRNLIFLIGWLLIAPLATSFVDLPHALRSFFMVPPLLVVASLGLVSILSMRSKIMITLFSLIFIIQFIFFIQKLYFLAPNEYSKFWSYSAKLASKIAIDNKGKYNYVLLSDKIDNMEFAYPVYSKTDPSIVINQNRIKGVYLKGLKFKRFDNVYIGSLNESNITELIDSIDGTVLVITTADLVKDLSKYETINGRTNLPELALIKK